MYLPALALLYLLVKGILENPGMFRKIHKKVIYEMQKESKSLYFSPSGILLKINFSHAFLMLECLELLFYIH